MLRRKLVLQDDRETPDFLRWAVALRDSDPVRLIPLRARVVVATVEGDAQVAERVRADEGAHDQFR